MFKSVSPAISVLQKEHGALFLRALMVKWLNGLVDFFSVNGTMDQHQVAETINLIIEEYPHYKPDDFKLCFNCAKKGVYGVVYGRIDGQVILGWLLEYDRSRDVTAQNLSIKEQEKYKERSFSSTVYSPTGVGYKEYLEIKKRAEAGDEEAIGLLTGKMQIND